MCPACFQRRPDRAFVAGAGLAGRLASPPDWLEGFTAHLAGAYSPARACQLITALGRLLDEDGQPAHPQALIERARWPGRSMDPPARSLEIFFTEHGLALPTDHAEQLAAARRQSRVDAVPGPLRPAAAGFASFMLASRERARRAGTRPRSDHTIEAALSTTRDLALFLAGERGKQDWALADVHDVEAFLALLPRGRKRRLTVLRQFFRFARGRKVILADPTAGLSARMPRGFTGQTILLDQQRGLFRRWAAGADAHPHEALLGILALLHGASGDEVRHLRVTDVDETARTARLGNRPLPVPLDPASWQVVQRCLAHRESQRTANPHVIVTKVTRAGRSPASTAYVTHLLDGCGVPPRSVRCTRLADLASTIDPKLVAAAFGMKPESVMYYLADHVDDGRLPQAAANPC
jgi:site-specific recombinase XerD